MVDMTQLADKPNQIESSRLRHRITVEEFEKAYFAGAFGQARLELIEGVIYDSPPMSDLQIASYVRLNKNLVKTLEEGMVFPRVPITFADDDSQPEPHFLVVKLEHFHDRKIKANEAALVIEVSDSTLEDDRGIKQKLYARNGVREYWIVNLKAKQLEVYRDPQGETFNTKFTLEVGKTCSPVAFPTRDVTWWV
jgi:Uma2 family endonuclease